MFKVQDSSRPVANLPSSPPPPPPSKARLSSYATCKGCSSCVQVSPRPVLTNVALQVPVLAADAASAQLEADLLKGNLQLTHARLHLADLVCLLHLSQTLHIGQTEGLVICSLTKMPLPYSQPKSLCVG